MSDKAADFWKNFIKKASLIETFLDEKKPDQALTEIEKILKPACEGKIMVSIGRRYGKSSDKFADHKLIELLIKPVDVNKMDDVDELFNKMPPAKELPKRWLFGKFFPPNPRLTFGIKVPLRGIEPEIAIETDDVEFIFMENKKNHDISLVIHVSERIGDKVLKVEKINEHNIYTPIRDELYDLVAELMGEGYVVKLVDRIIFTSDDLKVDAHAITELPKHTMLLAKNKFEFCQHCGVPDFATKLLKCVTCKKARYCSKYCQIQDLSMHKLICS